MLLYDGSRKKRIRWINLSDELWHKMNNYIVDRYIVRIYNFIVRYSRYGSYFKSIKRTGWQVTCQKPRKSWKLALWIARMNYDKNELWISSHSGQKITNTLAAGTVLPDFSNFSNFYGKINKQNHLKSFPNIHFDNKSNLWKFNWKSAKFLEKN